MSYPISLESSLESRAKASVAFRRLYDDEATVGADSTLWRTMAASIRGTMFRYIKSENDIKFYEWEAHAKNIDAEHPAQDRLIRLVLWARGLGVLSRTKKRSQLWPAAEKENHDIVVQEAVTRDGRIWVDLPYLVGDVRSAWAEAIRPTTSLPHRYNFTSSIARLASLGIRDNTFSGCGLAIMREALEIPRTIHHESPKPEIGQGKSDGPMSSMTIMDFHPMIMSWLSYAGPKLLRLSYNSYDASAWDTTQTTPGKLAVAAGVRPVGFSQVRFEF